MLFRSTTVKLRILRPGETAERTFTVARRTVTVPTVTTFRMLDDGATAYVFVDHFERKTPVEISAAVEALKPKGARRLVLDLRGNPGGRVDICIDLVSMFMDDGDIVSIRNRVPFGGYSKTTMGSHEHRMVTRHIHLEHCAQWYALGIIRPQHHSMTAKAVVQTWHPSFPRDGSIA